MEGLARLIDSRPNRIDAELNVRGVRGYEFWYNSQDLAKRRISVRALMVFQDSIQSLKCCQPSKGDLAELGPRLTGKWHSSINQGDYRQLPLFKEARMSPTRLADGERFKFLRVFGIGEYKGGMRRLLLRADKTESQSTRVDVLFMNTKHINIPTLLEGLEILDVTESSQGEEISQLVGILPSVDDRIYAISFSGGTGHVVAGSVSFIEDQGEYWEPSGFTMQP
jgi:hypothetical protein